MREWSEFIFFLSSIKLEMLQVSTLNKNPLWNGDVLSSSSGKVQMKMYQMVGAAEY